MYCPVYGCNSDSKNNLNKELHFFPFPGLSSSEIRNRRKIWIHFDDDAYNPAHSPKFLKSIGCEDQTLVLLRKDAVPTLNKPLMETAETKQSKTTEERLRRKVIINLDIICLFHVIKAHGLQKRLIKSNFAIF
jgi:hypothetical protein